MLSDSVQQLVLTLRQKHQDSYRFHLDEISTHMQDIESGNVPLSPKMSRAFEGLTREEIADRAKDTAQSFAIAETIVHALIVGLPSSYAP